MYLTHDMAMIQPTFTSSKKKMGEIFGLKFHMHIQHTDFSEIPSCGNKVIFATEFAIL